MERTAVDDLILNSRTLANGDILIAISCLGSTLAVTVPDDACLAALVPLLPPGWVPACTEGPFHETITPSMVAPSIGDRDPEHIASYLASKIEYAIAENSDHYVFLHAGVVVVRDRAVVLPGESHAGKSTLVAALVKQGAAYYSDEYAVIQKDGTIFPYPRPIALRNDLYFPVGRTDLESALPPPAVLQSGCRAEVIAFLTYSPNAALWIEPLDRTSALIALCQNTVGFRQRPDLSFAYLGALLDEAHTFRGTRGVADDAAQRIFALLQPK